MRIGRRSLAKRLLACLVPLATAAVAVGLVRRDLVISRGWVLRRDDLARLGVAARPRRRRG
jgi:hypothetical protein